MAEFDAGRSWPGRVGVARERALNVVFLNRGSDKTVLHAVRNARESSALWGCDCCMAPLDFIKCKHRAQTFGAAVCERAGAMVCCAILLGKS
jgi:hypothetical protein